MTGTVTIVVDLDAAGAPPAADSVRQLLVLLDDLAEQDSKLDWRLVSVSVNSPLRAQVTAFDKSGADAAPSDALHAASSTFDLLAITNDNEPMKAVSAIRDNERRRLKNLLTPLRNRSGSITVEIEGQPATVIRAKAANELLERLSAVSPKRRGPEYGSIEGQIISATTYYGKPALKVRQFLTGGEIMCVFEAHAAKSLGAGRTLAEVWEGQRILVRGKIVFDASGQAQTMQAEDLRAIASRRVTPDELSLIQRLGAQAEPWDTQH